MTRTSGGSRHRVTGILGAIALLAGAALLVLPAAGAATDPPPITDYAAYPEPGLIPATCAVDGPAVLVDVRYAVAGQTVSNLGDLTLRAGDVVVMSWAGFAPGCEGIGVSLSVKKTNLPFFDAQDNQQLLRPYDYCGPGGVPCGTGADGRFVLSLAVPPETVTCNFQFDATIGPPLEIVGPAGSYYSTGVRLANGKPGGPDMLIAANNGGIGDCERAITRVDKVWVVGAAASSVPPVGLPAEFAVVVESRAADDQALGSATCEYSGSSLVCRYAGPGGEAVGTLPVSPEGSLVVSEVNPPPGFAVEPSGLFQLADRFVVCDAAGCVLTVTNTEGSAPTTVVPPPTSPATTATTVSPATASGPGSDVGGTGTGTDPTTANTASGTLPRTGSTSRTPVLLAYALVATGFVLLLEAARRRVTTAPARRGRGERPVGS